MVESKLTHLHKQFDGYQQKYGADTFSATTHWRQKNVRYSKAKGKNKGNALGEQSLDKLVSETFKVLGTEQETNGIELAALKSDVKKVIELEKNSYQKLNILYRYLFAGDQKSQIETLEKINELLDADKVTVKKIEEIFDVTDNFQDLEFVLTYAFNNLDKVPKSDHAPLTKLVEKLAFISIDENLDFESALRISKLPVKLLGHLPKDLSQLEETHFDHLDSHEIKNGACKVLNWPEATSTTFSMKLNPVSRKKVNSRVKGYHHYSFLKKSKRQKVGEEVRVNKWDGQTHSEYGIRVKIRRMDVGKKNILKLFDTNNYHFDQPCYCTNNMVSLKIDKDLGEKQIEMVQSLLTLAGLSTALLPQQESDADRMKLLQLCRIFYPGKVSRYERSEKYMTMDPEELKKKMIKDIPEIENVINTHFDQMYEQEVFPGKRIWAVKGMAEELRKEGAIGLMAGVTSWQDTDVASKILKNGAMSSQDRFDRGLQVAGAASQANLRNGSGDHVFTRMIVDESVESGVKVSDFSLSGGVQILYDLKVLERGGYAYPQFVDGGSTQGSKTANYYKDRKSFKGVVQKIRKGMKKGDKSVKGNEFMIKNRIPPEYINGMLVKTEEKKEALIASLRKEGLIEERDGREYIKDKDVLVDDFIHVGDQFNRSMWDSHDKLVKDVLKDHNLKDHDYQEAFNTAKMCLAELAGGQDIKVEIINEVLKLPVASQIVIQTLWHDKLKLLSGPARLKVIQKLRAERGVEQVVKQENLSSLNTIQECDQALQNDPTNSEALKRRAVLHLRDGDLEKGFNDLKAVGYGIGDDPIIFQNLSRFVSENSLIRMSDLLKHFENLPLHSNLSSDRLTYFGNLYLSKNDLDRAMRLFSEALEADPTNHHALAGLVRVYQKSGDEQQYNDFHDLLSHNFPENELILTEKAQELLLDGKESQAQKLLEKALRQNPRNLEAMKLYSRFYNSKVIEKVSREIVNGSIEKAESLLREGISQSPDSHDLSFMLELLNMRKFAEGDLSKEEKDKLQKTLNSLMQVDPKQTGERVEKPSLKLEDIPDVQFDRLRGLFSRINFDDKDKPGYIDPTTVREGKNILSRASLEKGLNKLIFNIETRADNVAIPKDKKEEWYQELEVALRNVIVKMEQIEEKSRAEGADNKDVSDELQACARELCEIANGAHACGTRWKATVNDAYKSLTGQLLSGAAGVNLESLMVEELDKIKEGIIQEICLEYSKSYGRGSEVHVPNFVINVLLENQIDVPPDLVSAADLQDPIIPDIAKYMSRDAVMKKFHEKLNQYKENYANNLMEILNKKTEDARGFKRSQYMDKMLDCLGSVIDKEYCTDEIMSNLYPGLSGEALRGKKKEIRARLIEELGYVSLDEDTYIADGITPIGLARLLEYFGFNQVARADDDDKQGTHDKMANPLALEFLKNNLDKSWGAALYALHCHSKPKDSERDVAVAYQKLVAATLKNPNDRLVVFVLTIISQNSDVLKGLEPRVKDDISRLILSSRTTKGDELSAAVKEIEKKNIPLFDISKMIENENDPEKKADLVIKAIGIGWSAKGKDWVKELEKLVEVK